MMKRILYFVQLPPPVHGVSMINHYVTSSKHINEGFEAQVLRLNFSSSVEELRKRQLKKIFLIFLHLYKLVKKLVKFDPDLVYFSVMPVGMGFLRDFIYIYILKMFRAKLIFHLNNRGIPHFSEKWIWRKMYNSAFSNVNIIHVSENLLHSEIDILELKNTNYFVVHNTTKDFQITRGNKSPNFPVLLFISNLFQEKGLMVLLEAILEVRKQIPGIMLKIYGASRGAIEDSLYKEFIFQNGMSDYVEFNESVYDDKKVKALESADIFVFPSYFKEECFPLSLLEAMQAELPIIATNIGAIPEMIENGVSGILIDPQDPGMLQSAIEVLIKNPNMRHQLGKMAAEKFHREYAMEHFEKKMRKVILDVLK